MPGLIEMLQGLMGSGQGPQQQQAGGVLSPPGTPAMNIFGSGGQGGGIREFLQDAAPMIAMMDPLGRNNAMAAAMMQRNDNRRAAAEKQREQNKTVQWLRGQGLDDTQAQLMAADPTSVRQFMMQSMKGPESTSAMQNYQFLLTQGVDPKAAMDRAFSGGTTVNVGAGEKAWDTESAKLFAKRYDDITAGAMNAQQMMGMYDLAEQAFDSGVRTGFGAETELTFRQLGEAMGLDTDPEKLAGGELIRSVQNRMALMMRSPDGGMGMPGALSDRDIKFLKDSQIGIDRSPEGNKRMLQAYRLMEQRKIEIARLADEYVQQNGRLDAGFNSNLREYADANPLFEAAMSGGPRQIMDVEEYNRLPSGTQFIAPDGTVRRKP